MREAKGRRAATISASGRLVKERCRFRSRKLTSSSTSSKTRSRGDSTPDVLGHSSTESTMMYVAGCPGSCSMYQTLFESIVCGFPGSSIVPRQESDLELSWPRGEVRRPRTSCFDVSLKSNQSSNKPRGQSDVGNGFGFFDDGGAGWRFKRH